MPRSIRVASGIIDGMSSTGEPEEWPVVFTCGLARLVRRQGGSIGMLWMCRCGYNRRSISPRRVIHHILYRARHVIHRKTTCVPVVLWGRRPSVMRKARRRCLLVPSLDERSVREGRSAHCGHALKISSIAPAQG